ncbi:hypothetical protein [Azonexus sp. R2A61]|uniref:hypothetical protein n=1 Tax=Azonexus sp. R2A61 TaxID=2744443 RepID=UPI001F347AE3|nr:hypothetical protein [Azonexus sp. R2A61]
MAYTPPPGNNILGIFPASDYTPPDPTNLIGIFPADEAPIRRLLVSSVTTAWAAATAVDIASDIKIPAVHPADHQSSVAWPDSQPVGMQADAVWPAALGRDAQPQAIAWDAYDRALSPATSAIWNRSVPADTSGQGIAWRRYQAHLSAAGSIRWPGSMPVDRLLSGRYLGNITPAWREIFDPPADPGNIGITVIGGGFLAIFPADDDAPPGGDNIVGVFPAGESSAPPLLHPDTQDLRIPFRQVDFVVGLRRAPILDDAGQQVYRSAAVDSSHTSPWGAAVARDRRIVIPWFKYSRAMAPGWGVVVPGGDPQPDPGEQIIIPIRRVYIVQNDVTMVRADDMTLIHVSDLAISIEAGGLASFTGRVNHRQRDMLMPDSSLVEVIAWINGAEFRFLVDPPSEARQFGRHDISIGGRSLAVELSSDIAPARAWRNSTAMTAQQLVGAALEFTGYEIDWGIDDWVVPAGILSLYGTPLDVAGHVAEAVGAIVQCDLRARTLRFLPRYPVKPWRWMDADVTPDLVIPSAACESIDLRPVIRPDYNRVVVSGTLAGVSGLVTIAGSAGDKPAQPVVHPLITHGVAARQRGESILGASGNGTEVAISMQIMDSVGLVDIGRFIEFIDAGRVRRGVVRANRISTGRAVRQQLTVESS